jgi:hypothetical protein
LTAPVTGGKLAVRFHDVRGEPGMAKAHEFKFVVSGGALTQKQQAQVADAVAKAGVDALAQLNLGTQAGAGAVHFIPRDWIGRYVRLLSARDQQRVSKDLGAEQELRGIG